MYSTNRLTTLIDSISYRNQGYFDAVELCYFKRGASSLWFRDKSRLAKY